MPRLAGQPPTPVGRPGRPIRKALALVSRKQPRRPRRLVCTVALVRPEETLAGEVDEVLRSVRHPDFRLPN